MVTNAKNNGFRTNVDGREITLDNAESLLKDLENGKIDGSKYKKGTRILLMMQKEL